MTDLRAKTAITGVGTTPGWNNPGQTSLDQMSIAVREACEDAGVKMAEIDGLFTATLTQFMPALSVAEYLGIQPRIFDGTNVGGASFIAHLVPAMLALEAGLCDVACVCYGSNQASSGGKLATLTEPVAWEAPYKPRNPITGYALATQRHMHQYGTTKEQLAHVAVSARGWARLNPQATMRDKLSVEDVLSARPISDPLGLFDCCLVTDGGGAIILMRRDRAEAAPKRPVYILGAGMHTTHRQISQMPDLTVTGAVWSGHCAFEMAGMSTTDIDLLQLYDAFTINTLLFLEDLGFCAKGEAGPMVASGAIGPGGALPVNTNGGGLSCCHPGMYGVFAMIEAVRQLRGEAGDRQVAAHTALVHGNGGQLASQATAIFATQDAI